VEFEFKDNGKGLDSVDTGDEIIVAEDAIEFAKHYYTFLETRRIRSISRNSQEFRNLEKEFERIKHY
jgi:hypothetical protein